MLKSILDLLIPPKCHICGDVLLPEERFICTTCNLSLPRTMYYALKDNPMEMRFAGHFPFNRAAAHLFYTRSSAVASLIHDFKYRNFPSLARHLGKIMGEELMRTGFFTDIDYILPLPIHWSRRLSRGYNQTEYLAKGVEDATGIPVKRNLKTIRSHKTQTNLNPEERRINTSNLFILLNPEIFENKEVVIIDDVCTTGATLSGAAEVIIQSAPTCKINLLTLACTI